MAPQIFRVRHHVRAAQFRQDLWADEVRGALVDLAGPAGAAFVEKKNAVVLERLRDPSLHHARRRFARTALQEQQGRKGLVRVQLARKERERAEIRVCPVPRHL